MDRQTSDTPLDFEYLIREHSGRIRQIARRFASNGAVDDLVQDILTRLETPAGASTADILSDFLNRLGDVDASIFLTALLSKPRLFQTGAIPMPASRFACEHLPENFLRACTSRIHAQVPVVTTGKLTETLRQQIPRGIDVTVVVGPAFRTAPLPLI